jgi:signal peptidase I
METVAARPWWFVALVGRNPQRTLTRIILLVIGCFLAWKYVALPIRVEGVSMLPTYKERDINIINRLAYRFGLPQRGDVVAIRMAGEHVMLLKRVVGLPGETVAFRRGRLLVNGQAVPEPYVKLPCYWNIPPQMIGPDEYFVVGDNRSMHESDHTKGRADRSRIVGKALL